MVAKDGQRWAKFEKAFNSLYFRRLQGFFVYFGHHLLFCRRAANAIKNRFYNRLKDSVMYRDALARFNGVPSDKENRANSSTPAVSAHAAPIRQQNENRQLITNLGILSLTVAC